MPRPLIVALSVFAVLSRHQASAQGTIPLLLDTKDRTSATEFVSATGGLLKPQFADGSLAGWTQRGGKAVYVLTNETVIGTTVNGTPNSFLCTDKSYGDFALDLEVRSDKELNSGVQIRSQSSAEKYSFIFGATNVNVSANRVHGYQVEVDHRPERRWSGGIYEEGRRLWLNPLPANSPAGQAFRFGEWNHYQILCVGDSLRTWINGVPAADLVDSEQLSGFIALQVHSASKAGLEVAFRNVKIADLGRHGWKPLSLAADFPGSQRIGKGTWTFEDGVIHGTHAASDAETGFLVLKESLADFTMRFKFKCDKGNAGIYFRAAGVTNLSGLQVDIDADKGSGQLISPAHKPVVPDSKLDYKNAVRPGWNTMTVSARGDRVVVHVNALQTTDARIEGGATAGKVALQLHGKQDVDVWFKDFEMLTKSE